MPTLDSAVPLPSESAGIAPAEHGLARRIASAAELHEPWQRILAVLRANIRREQFETWFRRAALVQLDAEHMTVAVHNGFARGWLLDYYKGELATAVEKALGTARTIEIRVDPERVAELLPARAPEEEAPAELRARDARATAATVPAATPQKRAAAPALAPLEGEAGKLLGGSDVTLNPYNRFDNFVVGPCNRFPHAACVGVAEQPGKTYNPLFIHGN